MAVPEASVIFNDWDIERSESFIFFNTVWSVRMAKKILIESPRSSVLINPKDWLGLIKIINPSEKDSIDLTVPIILIRWCNGYLPIDGWHRLAKAVKIGIRLPAVKLNTSESSLLRLS